MKCDIIRDLIPLAAEGLCSEEAEKEIAEHIAGCESCRLLYETSPKPDTEAPAAPDEGETFKKVNRRIKRLTWKSWVSGGLLGVVLLSAAVLTVGQVIRHPRIPSFETIIQNIEVRKTAKYIAEGDYEGYVNSISSFYEGYDLESIAVKKQAAESDAKILAEAFHETFGDSKVVKMKVRSKYEDNIDVENVVVSRITYEYDNGQTYSTQLTRCADGKYHICYMGNFENNAADRAVSYVNWHEHTMYGIMGRIYFKHNQEQPVSAFVLGMYQEQYKEQLNEKRAAFWDSGFEITDHFMSHFQFDEEKQMCYYSVVMTAKDAKGTATAMTRLYYDEKGIIPPTRDEITVYPDGCTDELMELICGFFG